VTLSAIQDALSFDPQLVSGFQSVLATANTARHAVQTSKQPSVPSSQGPNANAGEGSGGSAAVSAQRASVRGSNTSPDMPRATSSREYVGTRAPAAIIGDNGSDGSMSHIGDSGIGSSIGSRGIGGDSSAVHFRPRISEQSNACDTCRAQQLPCKVPEKSVTGICQNCERKGGQYPSCSFVPYRPGETPRPSSIRLHDLTSALGRPEG
jgi:hypothetical protein